MTTMNAYNPLVQTGLGSPVMSAVQTLNVVEADRVYRLTMLTGGPVQPDGRQLCRFFIDGKRVGTLPVLHADTPNRYVKPNVSVYRDAPTTDPFEITVYGLRVGQKFRS